MSTRNSPSTGVLYVVSTPIGNLEDLTHRAVSTLSTVDLIACEDTRHTFRLLSHLGIRKPVVSYHDHNEKTRSGDLIAKLESGQSIALVSDAGTPLIADPGYRLVRECHRAGIRVVPVPGPSAVATALSVCGLPTDSFRFVGFLPARKAARRRRLEELRGVRETLVAFEAPHRISEMLQDLLEVMGDREVSVLRELTKLHESILTGKISEVRDRVPPLGEFVVVIEGAREAPTEAPLDLSGLNRSQVLRRISERLGVSRDDLYRALFQKD